MTINPPSIGSNPIGDSPEMIITLVDTRPEVGNFFTPTQTPGKMVGYYEPVTDRVELYLVNSNGNTYIRVS